MNLVSNPIGTKFKSRISATTAELQSFKSHRDKVQISALIPIKKMVLYVSNPIGTKFKYKKEIKRLNDRVFQIP